MALNKNRRFAARLNAFKIGSNEYWPGKKSLTTIDLIELAAAAGLDIRYREQAWLLNILRWPPHPTNDLITFLALEDRCKI